MGKRKKGLGIGFGIWTVVGITIGIALSFFFESRDFNMILGLVVGVTLGGINA